MPQAPERLRKKFMNSDNRDDGIQRCEKILKDAGVKVEKGVVTYPKDFGIPSSEVADAADFLCLEWDYAVQVEGMKSKMEKILKTEEASRNAKREQNPGDPLNGKSLPEYESLDYKPLWDFILAIPLVRKKTEGGIILPDNASSLDDTGRSLVIKTGPGSYNQSGAFIPNPITPGQYIYRMAKHMKPYRVIIDGKLYQSMPSSEVLAVASTPGGETEPFELQVDPKQEPE